MSTRPNGGPFAAIHCRFSLQSTQDSCVKPASSGSKISRPWSYFHFSNCAKAKQSFAAKVFLLILFFFKRKE
jgi:hypothetical protein